ncbi:mitochondrial processing peptidase [Fomitiporia mediterranea MF3/22]|uniref:mitochondrial processing peptidase n=1 Tax=Fomitiporia mediterranea (strain MF3/22) TaxID=694068 RepID=UPI0004407B89|nr:mitochondrial processing peptidase [Fomitiporia mediterranea MF3/22]EJC98724.1 mitochondrial processing peptidase [Fomitiporia mediterranea MF3/22]
MRKAVSSAARQALRSRRTLHSQSAPSAPPVQITTLPNKLRVATEAAPGHFAGVGLYVDAGSRYETPENSGVSHFLDRLAFKSTRARSDLDMSSAIHALGGQIQCSSSREAMMYQSIHFQSATPLAVSVIADTVLNPAFLPEEIEGQRDATRYEIREISAKPELILPEILHQVAYGGKGLGNPLLCPEERIDLINADTLRDFMAKWYRPERIVIAGAGMPHEELVEQTDKFFSSLKGESDSTLLSQPSQQQFAASRQNHSPTHLLQNPPSPSLYKSFTRAASYLYPQTVSDTSGPAPPPPTSNYKGGHYFIHQPETEFNHIYLAWEGPGIASPDIYALATMQMLLGGGGSFSAGGPGKGMYSRLYTHILNHQPQIDHCEAYHHIYTDSSLIGLFASFLPVSSPRQGATPAQIMPYLVHQISLLLHVPVGQAELNKAKNQLKSSLMMALESRAVEIEDLGRQILVHNRKVPVSEMCDRIDEMTPDDIRRVAHRVFGADAAKPATVVAMGKEDVGDWRGVLRKYGVGGA